MSQAKRIIRLDDPKSSKPQKHTQGKVAVTAKSSRTHSKTAEKPRAYPPNATQHLPLAKKENPAQSDSSSHSSSQPLETSSQDSGHIKPIRIISRRKYGLLRKVACQPCSPEYVCCGRFVVDFQELCNERQLPSMPRIVILKPFGARQIVENETKLEKTLQRKISRRKQGDGTNTDRGTGGASAKESKRTPRSSQRKGEGGGGGGGDQNGSDRQFTSGGVQTSASGTLCGMGGKHVVDYSKYVIQVKQADPDDDRTVSSIHLRGCRVDGPLMEIFHHCWPSLPSLRCLDLTLAGLQGPAFSLLVSCLPLCPHLHSLVLDSNPLTGAPLSALLGRGSQPWHLSLRFCGIGDLQARDLADSLGMTLCTSVEPPSVVIHPGDDGLVHLDLSNNDIGDAGATQLAEALKSNRSLVALSLANNKVGDPGVAHLAQALAWFPLSPDQEKIRRALDKVDLAELMEDSDAASTRSDHSQADLGSGPKKDQPLSPKSPRKNSQHKQFASPTPKGDGSVSKRPSPSPSFSTQSVKADSASAKRARKPSKCKTSGKRKESLDVPSSTKLDLHARKATTVAQVLGCEDDLTLTTFLSRCSDKLRYKPSWYCTQHIAVDFLGPHPFLMAGFLRDGKIWLPGNRTLVSLNVSGNRVGRAGMQALLEAVEEQMLPGPEEKPGLRRLVVHQNPASCPEGLRDKMKRKDPWFQCSRVDLSKEWILPCAIPVSLLM